MRPPEFTGGNAADAGVGAADHVDHASMRPPEFTGGNQIADYYDVDMIDVGFNEAAGIHRRKRPPRDFAAPRGALASMRPPEFTGGNRRRRVGPRAPESGLQ